MLLTVIQARMGSSRLPGKVLRDLGGRPVLSWAIRAAMVSQASANVVVATSTDARDDAVARLAQRDGAHVVRGSEDDVLARFLLAVEQFEPDGVIRLTADCPLLDPAVIRMTAGAFDPAVVDYVSTVSPRTLPRGFDVEVVATAALRIAHERATSSDRSHVTSYIWQRPTEFRTAGLTFTPPADDLRVTLDTSEDAALLDDLVAHLGDGPHPWQRVVEVLRSHPELVAINRHVEHRDLSDG